MQTFKIEVEGIQISSQLLSGLIHQYLNDVMKHDGHIVVVEIKPEEDLQSEKMDETCGENVDL